jgi:hypothetical protein
MNIIGAIDDENLLGLSIKDPVSFAPWKALLASAFGLPLDADQLSLYPFGDPRAGGLDAQLFGWSNNRRN